MLVQRFPPKLAIEDPKLDLDFCLRDLNMSTTHDDDIDPNLRFKDEEEELFDGEKVCRVETYVSTNRKEIFAIHCYKMDQHP